MARAGASLSAHSRLVEWSLVVAVIVVLGLSFGTYANRVRGQSELAAIRLTIGALRSTLATQDLRDKASGGRTVKATVSLNPFTLLDARPGNYSGVRVGHQPVEQTVSPGNWFFDGVCQCVAYRPLDSGWLDSPSGDPLLWFYVLTPQRSGQPFPLGPVQLIARENYRWQGEPIE